jgi:CHAT domain-containing protein
MTERAREFARPAALVGVIVAIVLTSAGARPGAAVRGAPARRVAAQALTQTVPLDALLAQAGAALDKSDYRRAAPLYERAVAQAEAARDQRSLAAALNGLGIARWGLGEYREASSLRQRLLDLAVELGDLGLERDALNGLGLDAYSQGDYPTALDYYHRALDVDARAPSLQAEGLVWANIGLVYRYQGRYAGAVAAFDRSLAKRRAAGDDRGTAQTLNHLGIINRAMGRFDRAIDYYNQSLAMRRQTGDRQGEAQTLNNLGNVYLDMGERTRALDLYQRSYAIARAIGYTLQVGLAQANVGEVLEELGRLPDALARDQAALAVYRDLSRRSQIADVLRSIGRVQSALGRDDAAARSLGDALEEARAIGEPDAEARTLDELGLLALKHGRADDALSRFDAALAIVHGQDMPDIEYAVLADRADALQRAGRLDDAIRNLRASAAIVTDLRARLTTDLGKIGFLDRRERVFAELAGDLVRTGRPADALEAAESGRARAFADLLSTRQVAARPSSRDALEHLRSAAESEHASPAHAGSAAPVSDTVAAALDALRASDGELASLIAVDSPTITEIRATAARLHAALVEYLVADEHTLVWVVEPDGGLHAATLPVTRASLKALVTSTATTRWRALGRALIDPIAAWLPADPEAPVVIVPQGPLAFVSFAALTDAGGRPLVERHTLVYAPAVSIYRYTAARASTPIDLAHLSAVVLADPAPPPNSGLAAMPAAREEARAVAAAVGAAHARVLTGAAATETQAKALLPSAGLIHIAAHGLIAPDRPLASSLALAASATDDGYLRVDEVFGLELRARLVALSGCSTGGGAVTGDGVFGLARAFLYAGTPAILASQWDVGDRATAYLMQRFYAALGRGEGAARALRQAELEARARYPAPQSWAGFILIGEP